ncbi:uncharacterized protein LOC126746742 isoform X3 [Anthonomus grandis grandis]|uniref:uncharacterized protein LOC126746742 isoform X3 n=1 Tax=Anthonomus grandis grandis TaxID=2921223 RepID=UPI0021653C9E|nr:uncharacterized protein LOC126746742 isoform X3 [Anthonomus grandis grandis]
MLLIGCVLAVLALVAESEAYSCPTCYKSACLADNVPTLKCTRTATVLPLGEITINLSGNTEYGCLELEYIEDGEQQWLKQCVTSNEEGDLCETLKKELDVTFCNVVKQSDNTGKLRKALSSGNNNSPSDNSSFHSDKSTSPSDKSTSPSDKSTSPSDKSTSPSDKSTSPSDKSTSPSDKSTSPSDTSTSPSDNSTPSSNPSSEPTNPTNPTKSPTSEQPETTTAASNKLPIQSFVTVVAFVTALTVILY